MGNGDWKIMMKSQILHLTSTLLQQIKKGDYLSDNLPNQLAVSF